MSVYRTIGSLVYITTLSKAVLLIWFPVFACFGVSLCTVSPSVYLDGIKLGLNSWVATF